jgi:hypothetical protein
MELTEYFMRQSLHSAAKLAPFVVRQSNPITGAPVPQATVALAPPAPPVIIT